MKQTQAEQEQQESSFGKYLNLAKAAGGALALGAAAALAQPSVRQGIRAARSTLGPGTIRAPGMEVGSDAGLRDRWEVAWARERARQRNT